MGLSRPELLLLLVPAAWLWWRGRDAHPATQVVRAAVLGLLCLALAGPYRDRSSQGRDLAIVVDRSRSMPEGAAESALELIGLAEAARRPEDRLFVVGFGADARVEHVGEGGARFAGFDAPADVDGSDVGAALETALALLPPDRPGSILLLTDGEENGRDALSAARRAFARGVRVDARAYGRPPTADVAVERFELPGEVALREPFPFHAWVRSDRRVEREFVLRRGDVELARGTRVFEAGVSRLSFRDVLDEGGVQRYTLELVGEGDRVPENDRGLAAVRAVGAPTVLVLNHDGAPDPLVRALQGARVPVRVARPEDVRLDALGLSPYRAVVLENVAAERLGPRGMAALARHVRERGAGLLMTGGLASFGRGGYYLSDLEDVLPVSMELRQEHRKLSLALAVALDRSGSMSVPATGSASGPTKMDLANRGTWEAVRLLGPQDSVAVIAVDSEPHTVVPLSSAAEVSSIRSRILGIESMGGGIYVKNALVAALDQLADASQANRHLVLFADAADAEQQGGCLDLVERSLGAGVSTSVVALGTTADKDATFLTDLAARGGGAAHFTTDPADLPRLFALDTMTVARSTFIEGPVPARALPDLFGLGNLRVDGVPDLGGYNLTYLKPDAQAGIVTADEYRAPVLAYQHQGLGRGAALTAQVGGSTGASLVAWDDFSPLAVTLVRWILGSEEPTDAFPTVRRVGRDARVQVEFDGDAEGHRSGELTARFEGEDGRTRSTVLERVGPGRYEGRLRLDREGVLVGAVDLGDGRALTLPPVSLPHSPEFESHVDARRGERLVRRLVAETGGELGVSATAAWRGPRTGRDWLPVDRPLILAALLLLLVEIAFRRLSLWGELGRGLEPVRRAWAALRARRAAPARPATAATAAPAGGAAEPGRTGSGVPGTSPAPAGSQGSGAGSGDARDRSGGKSTRPARDGGASDATGDPGADLGGALARARRAAKRELDR